MDIQTVMLIIVLITLALVSLCYFFDTRKYKEGTVHSERKYKDLKDRYLESITNNQTLSKTHEESINKFFIKTEELQQKLSGLNLELEKKDIELEKAYGQIDGLKAQISYLTTEKETNDDSKEV